jgi:hypothetical protein
MTPPARIMLHFGPHRTASTRTQGIFAAKLSRNEIPGIAFAGPETLRPRLLALLATAAAVPGARHAAAPWQLRLAIPRLARLLDDETRRVVLSEENLLGEADPSLLGPHGLYPRARERLTALRRFLGGAPAHPVLCVRRYDTFFVSLYSMVIRRRAVPAAEELARRWATLPRGWPAVVADVLDVFGTCVVVPYEALAGDELAIVKALVGEQADGLRIVRGLKVNTSMSARALEEIAAARASGVRLDRSAQEALLTRYQDAPPLAPFDQETVAALTDRYQADLHHLATLGATVWSSTAAKHSVGAGSGLMPT